MGSGSMAYKHKHQQQSGNRLPVLALPVGIPVALYQRIQRMAQVKTMVLFGNWIGFPMVGYSLIFVPPGGWKTDILWVLSCLFLALKIYFFFRRQLQDVKSRDLSLMKKEHDIEKEIGE